MTIYVLCFSGRYQHARHYIGFTEDADVTRRVQEHRAAGSAANPLCKAAVEAGLELRLAMTYEGPLASRTFERRLKNRRDVSRWCPLCTNGSRNPPPLVCEPLDVPDPDGGHAARLVPVRAGACAPRSAHEGVDEDDCEEIPF